MEGAGELNLNPNILNFSFTIGIWKEGLPGGGIYFVCLKFLLQKIRIGFSASNLEIFRDIFLTKKNQRIIFWHVP